MLIECATCRQTGAGDSLDFLGFTFRYDRDLYGGAHTYLNVTPSKKSLKKAREAIREKTGPKSKATGPSSSPTANALSRKSRKTDSPSSVRSSG
jgi:hypothetical protein